MRAPAGPCQAGDKLAAFRGVFRIACSTPDASYVGRPHVLLSPVRLHPGHSLAARLGLGQLGAWTSVHAFHEEARHCQGRSEELSS